MAKRDREAEKLIRLVPRRGPEKMGREAGGVRKGSQGSPLRINFSCTDSGSRKTYLPLGATRPKVPHLSPGKGAE